MIVPAPLQQGSTIGIIAPSGGVRDTSGLAKGIEILHDLGYATFCPSPSWPGDKYLSDNDGNRLAEFNERWRDGAIDAIMAARGGYGCLRIVFGIDIPPLHDAATKMLIGFSDITLLHGYINQKFNVATLHAPVVTSLARLSHDSIVQFDSTLRTPLDNWHYCGDAIVLQNRGTVSARSTGGNLSTIVSTLATPCQPVWKNKVVFLEDTAEPVYRVDRMFTQLHLAGMLDGVSAIILGDFSHGLGLDRNTIIGNHETIWNRVMELVGNDVTVWANFPMGHGALNYSVPLGMEIIIDSDKRSMYSRRGID